MAKQLVCISGSYRAAGIIEQSLAVIAEAAERQGWNCRRIRLVDQDIRYCRNCRTCTQEPGAGRGTCVIQDDVATILAAVDQSDALVLASPTNFYNATAVTRAFLERMIPCGYWPWGKAFPTWRNPKPIRPSVLITATAMPAIMTRFFTRSMRSLADLSHCLQARPVDRVYLGLIALQQSQTLSARAVRRIQQATTRLLK